MSPPPATHTSEFPHTGAAAAMPALVLSARLRAFRTIIKNEWRQLRPLRWVGYGLGILLPFLFIAGAHAASRGWSPLVSIPEYSLRTILIEAVPLALALGLWPLTALLTTTQAFTGERAGGTEAFLLERPLPPSHVWLARLAAASGATFAVALASGFAWLLLVSITGLLPDEGILHALRTLLLLSPYTLAATASVPIAASLLEQPFSVLLL